MKENQMEHEKIAMPVLVSFGVFILFCLLWYRGLSFLSLKNVVLLMLFALIFATRDHEKSIKGSFLFGAAVGALFAWGITFYCFDIFAVFQFAFIIGILNVVIDEIAEKIKNNRLFF